jgi:hypothetical protein
MLYRFFLTDELGHIFGRNEYEAAEDIQALEAAQQLCKNYGIEIWDGDRLVAQVAKGGTAVS